MTNKILNQTQAIAVRDAMCALNNVGGRLCRATLDGIISVTESASGRVTVRHYGEPRERVEGHAHQNAFFASYDIE